MTAEMALAVAVESAEDKAARYERALRALSECPLMGTEFVDWVQAVCDDVLEGFEAECWGCGTDVHEGPCVEDEPAAVGAGDQEDSRG